MTTHDDPARRAETADALSLAMLLLLGAPLAPEQRAVLVLREVLRDDRHLAQAGQAGTITIEGDRQAVAACSAC